MCAPGAIAWTASTSSVSSPYQPDASHWFAPSSLCGRYSFWLNCDAMNGCAGSLRAAYVDASEKMFGDAYESMIATVADAPVWPAATVDAMPYAERSCAGL